MGGTNQHRRKVMNARQGGSLIVGAAVLALLGGAGCSDDGVTTKYDGKTSHLEGGTGAEASTGNEAGTGTEAGTGKEASAGKEAGVGNEAGVKKEAGTPTPDGGGTGACLPNMGAADACGGNAIGSWKYKSVCTSTDIFATLKTLCPSATATTPTYSVGGTLQLGISSFTQNLTNTISSTLSIPKTCVTGSCTVVESLVKAYLTTGSTVACTATSSGGCSCAVAADLGGTNTGTYTVSGGIVTVLFTKGTYKYYYCLSGGTLLYRGLSTNTDDKDFCYVLTP
jgi:hypothetical protein